MVDTLPPFVDRTHLQAVVRQVLRCDSAEIVACTSALLHGGLGAVEARNTIHRIAGSALVEGAVRSWSVVLKTVTAPRSGAPAADIGHPDYWQREALTFSSDLLDALPDGFAAPKCFKVDATDESVSLWLEDVVDSAGRRWPLERFGVAAGHLGRFNGAFLDGRPLPAHAWLNRSILRARADRNASFWSNLESMREQPLFRRGWPGDLADRQLELFEDRHVLIDVLEHLPRTLRHADAGRSNLFARDSDSRHETVAIDWAYTGVGPIGDEIAPLVVASVLWFHGVTPADLSELDAIAFDGYLEGLRDTGWRGDASLVRLGCAATMALRFGPLLGVPQLVNAATDTRTDLEQMIGHTLEEVLDRYAQIQPFVLERADEARRLAAPHL
jgi:hypothetical protein